MLLELELVQAIPPQPGPVKSIDAAHEIAMQAAAPAIAVAQRSAIACLHIRNSLEGRRFRDRPDAQAAREARGRAPPPGWATSSTTPAAARTPPATKPAVDTFPSVVAELRAPMSVVSSGGQCG